MSHREQQCMILETAMSVTSCTGLEESLQAFALEAKKLLDFDRLSLNVVEFDSASYTVMFHTGVTVPELREGVATLLSGSETEQVINSGMPAVREYSEQDVQFATDHACLAAGFRSGLLVPLQFEGRNGAVLNFHSRQPDLYTDDSATVAQQLAILISPTVGHARLQQQLKDRTSEMDVVDEIARILTTTLDIDQAYEKFAAELRKLVDFAHVAISVVGHQAGTCTLRYFHGSPGSWSQIGLPTSMRGTGTQEVVRSGLSAVQGDMTADPRFRRDQRLITLGLRSRITVPLTSKGIVIGTLSLRSKHVGAYGPREQAIVERLASQIAPAVENAELYDRLHASNEEKAVVDEVARIVTSTLNIDEVYEKFAAELKKLVIFDRININFVDLEANTYTIKYLSGPPRPGRSVGTAESLENTQNREVAVTCRTIIRDDISGNPSFRLDHEMAGMGLPSNIMVPLIIKGRAIGVISLRSSKVEAYGPRDQAILERLASQIAPAVENAELYDKLHASSEEKAVVDEVARIVTSTLNIDEVYEKFAAALKKVVAFDRIVIDLIDYETDTFAFKYVSGVSTADRSMGMIRDLNGTLTQRVVQTGEPLIISDVIANPIIDGDSVLADMGLRSFIGVPLISQGITIGILALSGVDANLYGPREQAILERLASEIAPAIENAHLYEQQLQVQNEIRLSEERYRDLYENAPVGYCSVGSDGLIKRCNQRFAELLGCSPDEVIGQPMSKFHPDTPEVTEKASLCWQPAKVGHFC